MINRGELQERVREWGLREETVEKDYAISWILWGIAMTPALADGWAFKGGTCLKKCYIETYRFSEDLDFTVLPGGPSTAEQIDPLMVQALRRIHDESGLDVVSTPHRLKAHPSGAYLEGRVYYRGPRGAPQPSMVKLDIMVAEKLVRPTVLREVSHPYGDQPSPVGRVRCYAFDELFAEKLRAMGQRSRPRDLYDVVNLFRRRDLRAHPGAIRDALVEKCGSKGVPVPSAEAILSGPARAELEAEWANMLAHQLPALPPISGFLEELKSLFAWLAGEEVSLPAEELPHTPGVIKGWAPPPTIWTWGEAVPIEPLRFAAANHLCVELGYRNETRLVEPYSLRRTQEGHLLLMALRRDPRAIRSYRVDRIQRIQVTTVPFVPVYPVEFAAMGAVYARPIERRSSRLRGGPVFVVECLSCGRQFRRRRRNTAIRPHKDRSGWRCPGRRGVVASETA